MRWASRNRLAPLAVVLALEALLAGAPPPGNAQDPAAKPDAGPVPTRSGESSKSLKAQPPMGGSVRQEEMFSEDEARARVERGLVDPWFADLGKALLRSWDVANALRTHPDLADDLSHNVAAFGQEWRERASAFGHTGNPLPASAPNPKTQETYGIVSPGNDVVTQGQATRLVQEQYQVVRRAIVRVVQDAKGAIVSADLEVGSGDPQLDLAAISDIRAAALPRPPASLARGQELVSSEWQLDLVVAVAPLTPVVTFEFDEVLGSPEVKPPLSRKVYKRVRLLAVP